MSMTALADTKIPHMYSTGLYNEKGFDVAWEHTHKVLDVMVNGITQALSDIKSKDYPVAFVLKEKNDEFQQVLPMIDELNFKDLSITKLPLFE